MKMVMVVEQALTRAFRPLTENDIKEEKMRDTLSFHHLMRLEQGLRSPLLIPDDIDDPTAYKTRLEKTCLR